MLTRKFCFVAGLLAVLAVPAPGQAPPSMTPEQSAALKQQILKEVDDNAKLVQVMVDTDVQLRRAWASRSSRRRSI